LAERAANESAEVRRSEAPELSKVTTIYDGYFRVARVAQWEPQERLAAAVPALVALVGDLPSVGMPADDRATLLDLGVLLIGPRPAEAPAAVATDVAPDSARLAPIERWRLGHHLFALANRALAAELAGFADAMADPTTSLRGSELTGAHALLRAVTASMEYASVLSAAEYIEQVRPTMEPPHTKARLSGSMNRDYAASKIALSSLLDGALAEHDAGSLRSLDVELGRAVEELLSLDLLDFERHIALAHRLVGVLPALDSNDGSAVHDLRALYLRRLVRYLPFIQKPGNLRSAIRLPSPAVSS
jgi:hypothetical protein